MSDQNPFDDLAEETEGKEDSNDSSPDIEPESESDVERDSDTDRGSATSSTGTQSDSPTTTMASDTSQELSVEGPSLSNSSPPFPYSEAQQKQMYVQDGLWDEFEDLGFDAELELRRTFDVRNVEQRELDTAIIHLALDQFTAREIAEMLIEMRGFDAPMD